MRGLSFALTATTLAAAALLSSCSPPAAPTTKLGYHSAACSADYAGLPMKIECGSMVVEETRGANNGRTVVLPVVIIRATAADKKPDPVIYLHGGPGGGVVGGLAERLKSGRGPVTNDRDWIYFDQRGAAASNPSLDCGTLPLSDAGVTSDDGVKQLQACGKRLAASGMDLSQYNSATIVKDIRDLRKALGIKAYNLFGVSYGTRVAMAVMQHDPEDLRAVVLDSVWPPEASATGPLPMLVSREVRQILSLCASDGECNKRYPELERRFDGMLGSWLKAPVHANGRTYTADAVAAYLLDAVYDTQGARRLPSSLDALLRGDYSNLDRFMVAQSDYVEGQFFTHLCKEEFPFESPAAVETGTDEADPIAAATARDTRRFFPVCEAFPVGAPDPVENQPLTSAIPTLMLTADIDAGCPAELSDAAVQHLSHGKHFNFANRTHGVTRQSPCAKAMVTQFLSTTDPNVDSTCLKDDQPKFQFIYPS